MDFCGVYAAASQNYDQLGHGAFHAFRGAKIRQLRIVTSG